MNTKKIIFYIFVIFSILFFNGCGGKDSQNKDGDMNFHKKTAPNVTAILKKIKHTGTVPYKLDFDKIKSMNTAEWTTKSTLNSEDVKTLMQNTSVKPRVVEEYLLIDSLKSNDLYEEYERKTEFPVVYAQANIGEKIDVNESSFILLWAVYNEHNDGSGTFVFGTFFQNNRLENTFLLGEYSGGGYSEIKTTSTITDTAINIIKEETESYGTDKDSQDERITNKKYRITDKGLIIQKSQQPVSKNTIPSSTNKPPTVTIIVPENIDTYKTAMIEHVQEGAPNPLNSIKFVKKVKKISNAALIKVTAQVAANEIYSQGTSIEYFKILNGTAYIVLGMHIDGWAGVSVAISEVEPVVEKTLLQFPEVNKVHFWYAPGDDPSPSKQ